MSSKEELIAAERARRARKRAARDGLAVDPIAEAWATLGIRGADTINAIRDATGLLIEDLPDAGAFADLHDAVNTVPGLAFPAVLRAALAELDPFQLIRNMARLGAAGVPWIGDRGLARTLLLAEARPRAETTGPLPSRVLEGTVHWRLYLAVLGHPVHLDVEEIEQDLGCLPLALVDDLIDNGVLGAGDHPWKQRRDAHEASYLRARLDPGSVTREEANGLQWPEAVARHAYLAGEEKTGDELLDMLIGLHRGDRSQLFDIRAALPAPQRSLLQEILEGAQVGRWPSAITSDRRMWGLLVNLWRDSIDSDPTRDKPIDPNVGSFHSWCAYRVAYERVVAGDIDGAVRQVELFDAVGAVGERITAEVNNLRAYLAMRPGNNGRESLGQAELRLVEVIDEHPRVKVNLALVQQRRKTFVNDREPWENPYFVLGLPHGDPEWTPRWRELSRRHRDDIDALARVNEAWQRIRDAERSGSEFFRVPLGDDFLDISLQRSPALIPDLHALPRRTVTSVDDINFVKSLAAPSLLMEFDDTERGDRNGR